ncbi:UDP-N-acetylmuramate--L-alanine ligase [Candidatus Uhrbacteria bacterium CG_4_9_14_0_2_um_filter_41_50]|uniref:UDP-N-acetylmuramate--L-alanine ligase n=1 Tax=Candidatus Uhrbacteria bacterium CG_4_9_14_0_2_um_filter_41_50 TaxID=1975031 RepID=A0A2M8EPC9_9BACT|nr:MAG: UDP-N-acetylmuramate--L-alanine ligase [Candidatus Uhrbacteria bacterium CG_4_10_14_0_2_um_filter_41_21]PJB84261.1 MAG: UDP-N-acetylmuramate--L-alanine ligase [Candidatus Uhrbacteria bacterium CG_4_9_14_0_8_um_filter_41_16]PJC24588.1 MAG: UDP-N-acetylmuramate--L-alanine ligase [Candidatus Uhrbacteria bacterium CG_4_9_14_0_2_um_filter_41_50]
MIQAKNVHIIGIGGIGTSAVAKWWKEQGATVTGSDVHKNELVLELEKIGIDVRLGHFAENVPVDCDLIIHSRAVAATNVERQVASERSITDISYPRFLGLLAKNYKTIAIAGTNGKSTTTAMIASVLIEAGYDPIVILGTQLANWDLKNARIGNGDWFVTEACEHMASFLEIRPDYGVITNIEEDHLDFYNDLNQIRETFQLWVDQMKKGSTVFINSHDPESKSIRALDKKSFDFKNRKTEEGKQTFNVDDVQFCLQIPGEFNAMNAAAAVAVCRVVGIKDEVIKKALCEFKGTWRRFEHVGVWKDADVYSDYAHHPTAITGSIKAFKEFFPNRRLVVVFEPHQHSRTHELFDEFVESFDEADVLILSEVYEVVGRTEEKFETSKDMAEKIKDRKKNNEVLYAENLKKAESHLRDVVKPGDIIVCMGAGDIDSLARKIAK